MSFTPLSEKEECIARKTVDAVPNAFGPALARPARKKMMQSYYFGSGSYITQLLQARSGPGIHKT